jgi:hypothetical protein
MVGGVLFFLIFSLEYEWFVHLSDYKWDELYHKVNNETQHQLQFSGLV